jgi:UDP-N-acetylmuramyl pentapeptide phosphotransferase/UDP-N-acetylglucosamine-1-phosphate transferase
MAHPTARSSHVKSTPQGGGIAIIAAVIGVVACVFLITPDLFDHPRNIAITLAASVGIASVGVTDDVCPMEAFPRLCLQTITTGVMIAALPADLRVIHFLPWGFERVCLLIVGVWFLNLVNFMDGIDWMTVAEVVPVTAALGVFGLIGMLPLEATVVAVALCGAIIGFAPFNRPVAQLFLGDVGSLSIGFLLAWLLTLLAGSGHLAAAVLLPLYYLADATVTLVRRLCRREAIMQAHRSHFYQKAVDGDFTVTQIINRVFAANVVLAALAATSLFVSVTFQFVTIILGSILVCGLLWNFSSARN